MDVLLNWFGVSDEIKREEMKEMMSLLHKKNNNPIRLKMIKVRYEIILWNEFDLNTIQL